MTITDADLERIAARAAWPRLRLTLDCKREILPLVAAVREARQTCTCEGHVHRRLRFAKLGLICLDCGRRVKEP